MRFIGEDPGVLVYAVTALETIAVLVNIFNIDLLT